MSSIETPDSLTEYHNFIACKRVKYVPCGFDPPDSWLNPMMKPFQADTWRLSCRRGRNGCWLDTGLGKTCIELCYAEACVRYTNKKALILTPLAVANQIFDEANKFGINDVQVCRENREVKPGITITNYDRRHLFDMSQFNCVVLDEGSVMKNMGSATTTDLLRECKDTPYKLPATATPSPNDQMELGVYAEFLGAMSRSEMLSMFFVHDGGDTSKWRLRGHARNKFYEWLASFCIAIRKPSDLGYSNEGYDLPPLNFHEHIVDSPRLKGQLFATEARSLSEKRESKRCTVNSRIDVIGEQIQKSGEFPWLVWCELNKESTEATAAYKKWGAVEVTGSEHMDAKEEKLNAFSRGEIPILVTKGDICGFGMNWQHCRKQGHLGVTDSWEKFYQMIHRSYRFGQKREVDIHVASSEADQRTCRNLQRKQNESDHMNDMMVRAMGDITRKEIGGLPVMDRSYLPTKRIEIPSWIKSGW